MLVGYRGDFFRLEAWIIVKDYKLFLMWDYLSVTFRVEGSFCLSFS